MPELLKKLNSEFITGFIDAEGCFHISIVNSESNKEGKSVRVIFQISLHEKDKALLHQIKDYFGVGKVINRSDNVYYYQVTSTKDLVVLIEHLNKYPLITGPPWPRPGGQPQSVLRTSEDKREPNGSFATWGASL